MKEKLSKKDKYFDCLSKNMIIGLTDASSESQLRWFSVDVANKIKERYIIKKFDIKDNNIDCLLKQLNKVFVYDECNSLYLPVFSITHYDI
ncbi:hypothetical protein PS15m_003346 [Mucor circinelloides]